MRFSHILLILLAVVYSVSGQHHHGSSPSGDNPTAMVASIGEQQNSQADGSTNFAYSSLDSEVTTSDWQVNLDERQAINLGWTLDFGGNEVLFTLKINTTRTKFRRGSDIFALGFSDYGQIQSADFCLLWFDLAHTLQMRDAITDPVGRLRLIDKADSYCKLQGDSVGSATDGELIIFKFTRPMDTCQEGYYTIDNGTTHLVWFRMDGPLVVDLNKLNLADLQKQQKAAATRIATGSLFESGLTRVQLAATKVTGGAARRSGNRHHRHHSSSAAQLDIRMEGYEIPSRETTYWCKLFKLPHRFEQRKFHITKYEAIIEEGNEHIVHHMELFNCVYENAKQARDLRELYEQQGGWSGECGAKDRPLASQICRRVIMAWAMGAKPLEYPEQVGQSIGGHHYSPYVVLEVHYNNVQRKSALRDNSGLRFHYTHKLRPYDAGIMEVGLEYTDKNSIPPGVVAPLAGYCVSECTRAAIQASAAVSASSTEHDQDYMAGSYLKRRTSNHHELDDDDHEDENDHDDLGELDEEETYNGKSSSSKKQLATHNKQHQSGKKEEEEGIYIFAAQMHTHLAGVASWTEQIREGRLLRELQRDNHYSPHFQEIRLLPEPVHLAPGDALIHYCLYDTRPRANITLGGFATSDEMCVTYLHYYPKIDLEVCKSSVDSRSLEEYFQYLARQEGQFRSYTSTGNLSSAAKLAAAAAAITTEEQLGGKSVSEKYQSIEWSPRRSRELLEFYASSPLSIQCNRSNGDRFPGFWNGVTPTKVYWTNGASGSGNDQDQDQDQYQELGSSSSSSCSSGGGGSLVEAAAAADDPPGRQLAGGYSLHWGSQIMQYRGQQRLSKSKQLDRATKCKLASLRRRPGLV